MFKRFKWTPASARRNSLTAQYEPVQPYIFVEFLRALKATAFLDVGANIGQYSLFSRLAGCVKTVYAFEAEDAAYKELVANITANQLDTFVHPIFKIASSVSGELRFGVANPMAGNNGVASTSIHNPDVYKETRLLQAVTLDETVSIRGTNVAFKVDVEGHELDVLKGATSLLTENKCIIQVEIYKDQNDVPKLLSELGYNKILAAGPDLYFSNDRDVFNDAKVLRVVEAAFAALISYNLRG